MQLHFILVFLSVIVLPDGQIKARSEVVTQCPSQEYVHQMHQPMMDRGEIIYWAANCRSMSVELPAPNKGLNT